MGYPIRRRGKSRRSRRIRRTAIVVPLMLLILAGGWGISRRFSSTSSYYASPSSAQWMSGDPSAGLSVLASQKAMAEVNNTGRRVVYPYSVVPGGVRTPEELKQISDHDRVVASHYAGFDFRRAHVEELQRDQLVYLSYRLRDKIFWTRKKVALHKGEKVITDGKITGRTRCANQVSPTAQAAVSPEEPPIEKFDEPMLADGSSTHIPAPGNFQSSLLTREFSGLGGGAGLAGGLYGAGGSGGFPPVYPPPIPTGGGGGVGPPPPPPPPPPPAVPEPGTIVLVASGMAALYARYRKNLRK